MLSLSTILQPTDFSAPSEQAFDLACSLARREGGRIIVLHVAQLPLSASPEEMLHPPPGGIWQAIEEQLQRIKAPDSNVRVEHRLMEGDPVREILKAAQESKCDLIVMGTHGRTGLRHLLMGSVAEQIVRRANCPVLVAKEHVPDGEKERF